MVDKKRYYSVLLQFLALQALFEQKLGQNPQNFQIFPIVT